jgi:hypothetical protein
MALLTISVALASASAGYLPVRRIRFWQHGRALRQMAPEFKRGEGSIRDALMPAEFDLFR